MYIHMCVYIQYIYVYTYVCTVCLCIGMYMCILVFYLGYSTVLMSIGASHDTVELLTCNFFHVCCRFYSWATTS